MSVEARTIDGLLVEVTNTRSDIVTARVFERATAVLYRIRRYAPHRYVHMKRDVAAIVVQRFPCRAAFFTESRTCLLELTFMANSDFSDSQVAASLIHEAMHARLDRMVISLGIPSYEIARARHERICRRAELEFGAAVPDGLPVIERAIATAQLGDDEVAPTIDWRQADREVASADESARIKR